MRFKQLASMAMALGLCACERVEYSTEHPAKVFSAHGRSWEYRATEVQIRQRLLAAFHAGGNGYREVHVLRPMSGGARPAEPRMLVNDRLYALQKNGAYKKITCCDHFREKGRLHAFDGKLVFEFSNNRKYITDCFVYPPGHPENEEVPEGQRIFGSTVYGVFDPERAIFLIDTFDAGRFSMEDYEKAGAGQSIETSAEFAFGHRRAFKC